MKKIKMKDYIMPKESALASNQLEYTQTRDEMYSSDPHLKDIMDKADKGQITPDEAIALIKAQCHK